MPYEHTYPLFLHRDDGYPGKVVENAAEAQEAFRQGFKLWTPDGLVNPVAPSPEPAVPSVDAPAEPKATRKKKG